MLMKGENGVGHARCVTVDFAHYTLHNQNYGIYF